jgi:SAM-dependent methyltransferase
MFFKSRKIDHAHIHRIINEDLYISTVYRDIYKEFFKIGLSANMQNLKVLEIGGGDLSYSREFWNHAVITDAEEKSTDESIVPGVNAENLPFNDSEFDLVIAKDSLHHFKDPLKGLGEIQRVLKSGGKFIVSEPNWSPLGRFVYRFFHPEPWNLRVSTLNRSSNDLWDSNQALLFLLTNKFKENYVKEFPNFKLEILNPTYGISYLLSGGVHKRTLIPSKILLLIYKQELKNKLIRKITGLNILAVFSKI